LTGGWDTLKKVSVYSTEWWLEDLPEMLTGRSSHGCGHYVNNDNKMVYLVAGGYSGSGQHLVSTEILVSGSSAWLKVGDLPTVPIMGLRGVSFNNKIIMTGGGNRNGNQNYVLSYNVSERSWNQVGNMRMARSFHGASLVPVDQIIDYCLK